MSKDTDNLGLECLYWDGCTFWYSDVDNKFTVYENLTSLYNFSVRMAGASWTAEAYRYGNSSPEGVLNWLADYRGRSLLELLSLVVIVYKDNTDALVFTNWKSEISKEIIQRAAELRISPPEWTKKFRQFEFNFSSEDLD